jgi:serine phosphatase RsbU (regulator of sigma subunit)
MVLVVGFAITAVMALGARSIQTDNEDRLLRERAQQVALVASAAVPNVQIPLASAALLAESSEADEGTFQDLLGPEVGPRPPARFVSASIWSVRDLSSPVVTLGSRPKILSLPASERRAAFDRSTGATVPTMAVVEMLRDQPRRLGYVVASPGGRPDYAVYAEAQLPRNRRSPIDRNSAFSDLDYALYLGTRRDPATLLASSTGGRLPLPGKVARATVPFGDRDLLVVLKPHTALGGEFLANLPWYLAAAGLLIAVAAALLSEFLIRRREHAERLAGELEKIASENARLLADQRSVAYTLQHSLLPDELPEMPGLELGVRYVAGVEGVDIGGDWYDVVPVDEDRLFFVVGDVSGRGVRAATIMASLRYAIRAYTAQGDDPATVLTKLSKLLSIGRDGYFATVLCGVIDVKRHEVTLASAGHPYPLLVTNGHADYVTMNNGVPVGVVAPDGYQRVIVSIPARATLLVFTDGLVERRGEPLDAGFSRLRAATAGFDGSLEDLLTKVVSELSYAEAEDDTALLGIRWTG